MRILLIGCGNIGEALLNIWQSNNINNEIFVVEPNIDSRIIFNNVRYVKNIADIPSDFEEDMIIIAVKPQNLQNILPDLEKRSSILVSTIAGITTEQLNSLLPEYNNIIRIMPNIAIKTGNSVNLAFASKNTEKSSIELFYKIFSATGKIVFVKDEQSIDQLTPIFGSGPAYFFSLANILLSEVIKIGLDKQDAKTFLDQLFIGSASLVDENISYDDIIKSVASKNGVTEAILKIMNPEIQKTIEKSLDIGLLKLEELRNENRS